MTVSATMSSFSRVHPFQHSFQMPELIRIPNRHENIAGTHLDGLLGKHLLSDQAEFFQFAGVVSSFFGCSAPTAVKITKMVSVKVSPQMVAIFFVKRLTIARAKSATVINPNPRGNSFPAIRKFSGTFHSGSSGCL